MLFYSFNVFRWKFYMEVGFILGFQVTSLGLLPSAYAQFLKV